MAHLVPGGRGWQRRADVPALRHFSEILLQVETPPGRVRAGRAGGSGADAQALPARDAAGRRPQDRLLATAVPLRTGTDCPLPPALSPDWHCRLVRASARASPWHEAHTYHTK